MKTFDSFGPNVRLYAPGVSDPTMYFALREAAIEFCERTRLWRYEDVFTVTAEQCEAIFTPDGTVVHEIEKVEFDGQELDHVTPTYLDQRMHLWRTDGAMTGIPRYVTQTEPNTIRLLPQGSGTVGLFLWLKPSQDAEEVPDWMADQYRETIAYGALGRILLIPNQSFTNLELGAAFGAAFQAKLDGSSTKGFTGQQRAFVRTRATFF